LSGFLDGVLKPGQGAEMAVKREMEQRRRTWTRPGYHYRGVGDFLLQHGKFWTGREIPERYRHLVGPDGSCYANALAAVRADSSLRYVEGVYAVIGRDFHGHAWCIDQDEQIVEVTAPTDPATVARASSAEDHIPFLPVERWAYYGCVFPLAYVEAHRARYEDTQGYPLFDLNPAENRRQFGSYQQSAVGWGDEDGEDEDDTDWDEPDVPSVYRFEEHEFPVFRVPFDPNRTTL
jgi:hypothetical protein